MSKKFKSTFGWFGLRVHNDRFLTLMFLDLLDIRHILVDNYLVVSPLSSSISTSELNIGCIMLLLIMYP